MLEAEVLIQHYLEGRLTEDEAAELHRLLEARPELGEELLEQLQLDSMMRQAVKAMPRHQAPVILLPRRRFSFGALIGVAAAAAVLAIASTALWEQLTAPSAAEATTTSVAVLSRSANVIWEAGGAAPVAGAALSPGWLRIKSGLMQIEFYQGARVSVEGPAALELVSAGEAFFAAGKLSAHVPPQAKGFRINTKSGSIVDLGTEFALDVNDAGAEVHVFDGEVELHHERAAVQPLTTGQAMEFAPGSALQSASTNGFASLLAIDAESAAHQRVQFERWSSMSKRLNQDPSVLLHFDFQDSPGSRMLGNRAGEANSLPDASIVASQWTQGRWPGKQALEFRQLSDRVRVSVPGILSAFTLATRVRVDGLERAFNSLFMSEAWGERRVHWQITKEGIIRLGVAGGKDARHTDYDSMKFFTPERFGQWMLLAVVFDPVKGNVTHFANGESVGVETLTDKTPVNIGLAELGNWSDHAEPGRRVAIRHLSGAMEEFVLWNRALSADELAALVLP